MLGEVDQFRDEAEIKSYHTIDIDIPEDKPKEKTEPKEKKEASQTPVHQFPNTEKPPRAFKESFGNRSCASSRADNR